MSLHLQFQRFGRLIALEPISTKTHSCRTWKCQCDCGNIIFVRSSSLKFGNTKSCGCWQRDKTSIRSIKHGHAIGGSTSKTYNTWCHILRRCYDKRDNRYYRYGGRGISVCERWQKFENFLADMGKRPSGLTIDRINNDGNYEPGNCRWATYKEQANNRCLPIPSPDPDLWVDVT